MSDQPACQNQQQKSDDLYIVLLSVISCIQEKWEEEEKEEWHSRTKKNNHSRILNLM